MSRVDRGLPSQIREQSNIVLVTGVPGAGKDHYLSIGRQLGIIPKEVKIVGVGDLLFGELRRNGLPINNKDDIRKLDHEVVDRGVRTIVDQKVAESADSQQPLLLNVHVVYRHGDMLVNDASLYSVLAPRAIIHVMGYPDDFSYRREKSSRIRPPETLDEIEAHQAAELATTLKLASSTGIELRPLMSRPKQLVPNVLQFAGALRDGLV